MRHVTVTLVALAILGSAAALPATIGLDSRDIALDGALAACAGSPACAAAVARAHTDALAAQMRALPQDVASTVAFGLAQAGFAPADLAMTRSATLQDALLGFYAVHKVTVDHSEVHRQADALAPGDAAALRDLVDAATDAQLASARILAPADLAALRDDLRTQMLQLTLQGDRALAELVARADMAQAAAAATRLANAMASLPELLPVEGCGRAIDLPFIVVGAPCDDVYPASQTVLILVDYGGNDRYENNAGAGIAGIGVGIAIDQGEGADTYRAARFAQGSALAGVGILMDEGGSDRYNLTQFGQGFGVAGVGLLYDQGEENDIYESPHAPDTIGTKAGGLGGVGILRDEGGSDSYQSDGLDAFVYGAAGGLGLLLDHGDGNDSYLSRDLEIVLLGTRLGEFVGPIQVSAEVDATAILFEDGGDDSYTCGAHVRQGCQGAGGVGGVALLLDMAGNDVYRVGASVSPVLLGALVVFPSGQGVAYGEGSLPPGAGVGILRDLAGDDAYVASSYAQGYATGGVGLLLDEAGVDAYSQGVGLVGARGDGQTWLDGLALGIGIDQ